ncbi:hypothetical protein Tco_0046168 [Tanacetum coccineum]
MRILKKFNYTDVKSASTPVDLEKPLVKDGDANDVDVHLYRSMIGSLMYLTASRPDIVHVSDSNGQEATVVATSTTEAEYVAAASCCGQASQKEVRTLRYLSLVVPLKKVGDEAVHKELGDRMERAATTTSSLEAEQENVTAAELLTTVRHHLVLPVQVNAAEALVDKKKVIIMETSIRSDLHLEDAGGTDCLPTATIFEELARMGCYHQQLGDMSHHKKIYVNPSHIKKIFANMKREGKDFSGRVTPLFATMMVQANQEEGVDSGIPTDSQ